MTPSPEKKAAWNIRLLHKLWELDFLPEEPVHTASPSASAKGSLLFALSGMCYFFLYIRWGEDSPLIWSAVVAALFVLTQLAPAIHRGISLPRWGKLLALFNAVGAMGAGVRVAIDFFRGAHGTVQLAGMLGVSSGLVAVGISGFFGLCGLWFLYVLIARVYTALSAVTAHLFRNTGKGERCALALLVLGLGVFTAVAFSQSRAFYAPGHNYDVIFTSDSPYLVMGNTWLNLTFAENDLRQPLFAVFAAPFVGWAYVLGQLAPAGSWVAPWLMNLPQLALLVWGVYMLASLLGHSAAGRLAVTVSLLALYPSLLFAVMMEQYMVAVFWLLLFVYMTVAELPGTGAALMGAAGSLLTSAAMLPGMWLGKRLSVKKMAQQALCALALGAFLVVLFLRLEVVLSLGESVERLSGYAGESVSLMGRLRQYVAFAAGCFEPPLAGESMALGYPAWQLLLPESFRLDGIAVLVMCALGFWLGRRERLVQLSGWWCLFSLVLLVGLGWGTAENGLMLYGLYFSWSFYVLFRRAVVWPGRWQPVADGALALLLLVLNIPAMAKLLDFAITHYPV